MIRLIFLSLLTLIALLTICKAPTYHLWLLAIAVTEFPLILASLILILLLAGIWWTGWRWTGTWVGIIGLALSLSPIFRAYTAAATLKYAFGLDEAPAELPFSWTAMIGGTPKAPYRTFTYKTGLTMDVYTPPGVLIPRPCVVVIHGGSWSSGNSQQLPDLNGELARKGYLVASMNYRLAPQYQNPAPVEDVADALAYLRAEATTLGIDTTRFVLLGRSAGAQIALLAAYTLPGGKDMAGRTAPGAGIRGVIDFYGPADMIWGYSVPSNPLIMDSRKVMEDYLGGPYPKVPDHYASSSPLEALAPHAPPTLIIHGANDVVVAFEHSIRLNRKLAEFNIPHYFLQLPWATHGCDFTLHGPSGQLSTFAVESFLEKTTR